MHFGDPEDRSKTEGWQWAVQHGFTHIDRLSEEDAATILDHLGFTPHDDEYSDGLEEMLRLQYPWKWLENYCTKHGDMKKLNVQVKIFTVALLSPVHPPIDRRCFNSVLH